MPIAYLVLIPGLDDEDQRVKISSLDDSQQGILDSFKSKVGLRLIDPLIT